MHILGTFASRLCNQPRFFCTKVVSPSLWTRDALRHLQAGKYRNCNPARVGCNCGAGRILVNASASFHHRRCCLGVLALSGRFVHGTLAGWAQKVAKISRGTYREVFVFWRPSAKVAAKCSFVLLGAGPRLQPARTLGVIAVVHRTMQTALMLRILLHMQRGTIRRRAPREAQRPGDRSHRNLREAWPADIKEWTTAPLQYGGILFGTPPSLMQQLRHCLGKPDGW